MYYLLLIFQNIQDIIHNENIKKVSKIFFFLFIYFEFVGDITQLA